MEGGIKDNYNTLALHLFPGHFWQIPGSVLQEALRQKPDKWCRGIGSLYFEEKNNNSILDSFSAFLFKKIT